MKMHRLIFRCSTNLFLWPPKFLISAQLALSSLPMSIHLWSLFLRPGFVHLLRPCLKHHCHSILRQDLLS